MKRMDLEQAQYLTAVYGIPTKCDFHALDANTVDRIVKAADDYGYRKPRNANGSRARYFHAYLCRVIEKGDQSE